MLANCQTTCTPLSTQDKLHGFFLYTKTPDYAIMIVRFVVANRRILVDVHYDKTPKPFANQVKDRKVMMLIPSSKPKACRS